MSTPRVRWADTRILDNRWLYRIAVWRGWICSPSLHALTGRCTYHHRHPEDVRA